MLSARMQAKQFLNGYLETRQTSLMKRAIKQTKLQDYQDIKDASFSSSKIWPTIFVRCDEDCVERSLKINIETVGKTALLNNRFPVGARRITEETRGGSNLSVNEQGHYPGMEF